MGDARSPARRCRRATASTCPRKGTGATSGCATAVIPDPRNDENLAVAQTHLAFIRFHNRVRGHSGNAAGPALRPSPPRVVQHYQWMIRHDFLPRICDQAVVDDVFANGRKVFEAGVDAAPVPTMPLEFSVAAYRLGHSMIRPAYSWNRRFDDGSGTLDFLFIFSSTGGVLGGDRRLPSNWIADFRRLYDFTEAGRADQHRGGQVQPRQAHRHAHDQCAA